MIRIKLVTLSILLLLLGYSCKSSKYSISVNPSNWRVTGDSEWILDQNQIVGNSTNGSIGFISTNNVYKDFILEMDFYPDATINSGVYIRCEDKNPSAQDCYEVNIWDSSPNQKYRTGAIVNKFSQLKNVETINRWNRFKAIARNNDLKIWINGIMTMDAVDSDHTMGHISLQARGEGKIIFKNIRIQELN